MNKNKKLDCEKVKQTTLYDERSFKVCYFVNWLVFYVLFTLLKRDILAASY